MQYNKSLLFLRLFQFSVFALLIGRGWQHLFWDAPYRTLLWDEQLIKPLLETCTSIKWGNYITNLKVDSGIQLFIKCIGAAYILTAITIWVLPLKSKVLKILLTTCGISLIFLAALYGKEKFYSLGQFLEYSLQFMSPFFLLWFIQKNTIDQTFLRNIKIAIALTFICHGLYAMNYYPLPGAFIDMTLNIFGMKEQTARQFLMLAGILDILAAALLFLPGKKALPALGYIILWGFLTTFARIVAHFSLDFPLQTFHQWGHETLYRFPHFIVPVILFLWIRRPTKNPKKLFRQSKKINHTF